MRRVRASQRYRLDDPPVRRVLAADFPYAGLYAVKADYVWVGAVMPLKRRPGYWKHRLTHWVLFLPSIRSKKGVVV